MKPVTRHLTRLAIGAGLSAALVLPASAVVTSTWTVETYQQLDAGDATSAFITSTGELRPGWDTKRTALEGDAVWASLPLADGSVLEGHFGRPVDTLGWLGCDFHQQWNIALMFNIK